MHGTGFLLASAGPQVGLGHHVLFGADGQTSIAPAVLTAAVIAIAFILSLPRKYVVLPLILLAIFCPLGQTVMMGSFHLQIFRILLLFTWIRLLVQRYIVEASFKIVLNHVDKALILYAVSSVVCYSLLWQQSAAFFSEVGTACNILGFYFAFRFFIRDQKDIERAIKGLAITAVFVAAVMFNEQMTGRNSLATFGGVPEFTATRDGYLRSQGPFTVFLTAGAFGATLVPLFLALWHKGGSKIMAAIGILAAITITITSHTSTAISACLATLVGLGMWKFRNRLRQIRWGVVLALVGLHLTMKAPVWALLARVDIVGGSTGWQRFKIVDNCIRHFWDWWLVGSNNYWTWDGGDDMWDLANQYVFTAETTGLLSLIFFLAAIVYCFKYLGKARKTAGADYRQAWFVWLLGVALFCNLTAFFGIAYTDQIFIYWYLLLAIIVTATLPRRSRFTKPAAIQTAPAEVSPWHPEPVMAGPIMARLLR